MKLILGDNQFFGINHFDLEKGAAINEVFDNPSKISAFIREALSEGMDGFMMNSNDDGYEIISKEKFDSDKEIHYSIPYAHKYANMVNEDGMMSLLSHIMKNTSMVSNIKGGLKLLSKRDMVHLVPLAVDLEVPKELPKGSFVYLQNIITDLIMGLGRYDLIAKFIESTRMKGYRPGLVTLNPIMLDKVLRESKTATRDVVMCFNINAAGFNVFPSKNEVATFARSSTPYRKMGMSIFASGAGNIPKSIEYIKYLDLDYAVFGTSRMVNLRRNLSAFSED